MGKLKETNDGIYSSTLYSSALSDYPSGLERPTFIGLVEIIKTLGFSDVDSVTDLGLQLKNNDQFATTTTAHFVDEYCAEQMGFQEIS